MKTIQWLLCPVCKSKTRLQIREDTELKKLSAILPEMQTESFAGYLEIISKIAYNVCRSILLLSTVERLLLSIPITN